MLYTRWNKRVHVTKGMCSGCGKKTKSNCCLACFTEWKKGRECSKNMKQFDKKFAGWDDRRIGWGG